MKLYHGSDVDIEIIDLQKSMKGKDFGQGFYLTTDRRQAHDIAVLRSLATMSAPVINVYEFDENNISNGDLKVLTFDSYSPEWAEFILKNRRNNTSIPAHDYDIVYGPIANDRVGQQIRRLLDNEIDLSTFIERLKFMKGTTFQYFFGTPKAIALLQKLPSIYYGK